MTDKALAEQIADAIKAHREREHLTQRQLADRMNVSVRTVSRWETAQAVPDRAQLQLMGLPAAMVALAVTSTLLPPGMFGFAARAAAGVGAALVAGEAGRWLAGPSADSTRKRMLQGMIDGALGALTDEFRLPPEQTRAMLLRFAQLMREQQVTWSDVVELLEKEK